MIFEEPIRLLQGLGTVLAGSLSVAFLIAGMLLAKSIKDFSHAGPQVRGVVRRYYRGLVVFSLVRLALWATLVLFVLGVVGSLSLVAVAILFGFAITYWSAVAAAAVAISVLVTLQFSRVLLYKPSLIAASSHYRMSRLYRFWARLTSWRLSLAMGTVVGGVSLLVLGALLRLAHGGEWMDFGMLLGTALGVGVLYVTPALERDPKPVDGSKRTTSHPNIVMIGCDTLRADRLGVNGYGRDVTPFMDKLARSGVLFSNCYVPVARTAPSLMSLMSGTWPQRHGIRDNFVTGADVSDDVPFLARVLRKVGYRCVAISDWAGSDLTKFDFGFEDVDAPQDQWNVKYLIRQGPKDLRLFLSLFVHNRFGKRFLPEIYYLAGTPLTRDLGRATRRRISEYAKTDKPFFINVFMATAHPPFGAEYPYYLKYSDQAYSGESKFVMSKLTDPFEIIRSQREPKEAFDLDQIINLYDGCVRRFDDEVRRIVTHLELCGLSDNTVVVVYSDHGMEFFEHDTWGQGNSALGDFSARVPLLLVDPRRQPIGRTDHLVRSVDLAPTLLDLVGVNIPPGVEGESLVEILDHPTDDPRRVAYFETGIWLTVPPGTDPDHLVYPDILEILDVAGPASGTLVIKPEYERLVIRARDRMVREGEWVMVYLPAKDGARYRLFNLRTDPDCSTDVAADYLNIVTRLRKKLDAWMKRDVNTRGETYADSMEAELKEARGGTRRKGAE